MEVSLDFFEENVDRIYSTQVMAAGAGGGDVDGPIWLLLSLVALLIALTAFFVGSEFAVVKVRMSRLDQLVVEGNKSAVLAKKVASDLDYYLSACQLGITVTALGLGFLGEPSVVRLLTPLFNEFNIPASLASVISFITAFAIVTFLHVVIGELAPKSLAIQYAERMTLIFARPLFWFGRIMFPFIWLLNGSARLLLGLFGVKPAGHEEAHSEEELKIIMTQSFQSGEINQTELAMMQNIFSFDQHVTKDVMVPRTKVEAIDIEATRAEVLATFADSQYTRYPIMEGGDKDHLIGYINVKEVLMGLAMQPSVDLKAYVKELPVVHEMTPLEDTLKQMREVRTHIAIVLDEYGGTSGLITLEDLLEEIVGEIRDEFDEDEVDPIHTVDASTYDIDTRVRLDELEGHFGLTFENAEEIDTLGGWLQVNRDENIVGTTFEFDRYMLTILEMTEHHVERVRLIVHPDVKEA